jgi:hypothetical protein
MSKPIRYAFRLCEEEDAIYLGPKEQADGQFVLYADYASLKADIENCRIALRVKYDEVAKFKAKVERLTKAGDEMARVISSFGFDEVPIAWNRAKEGKQS